MGPSLFTYKVADEHAEEMRARARAIGRASRRGEDQAVQRAVRRPAGLSMRVVEGNDPAVRHLAALDAMPLPGGRVLLAEVDGAPRAALPLEMDWPIADPFFPTAELVALLRLRAEQLRPAEEGVRGIRSLLARVHPGGRHGAAPHTAL